MIQSLSLSRYLARPSLSVLSLSLLLSACGVSSTDTDKPAEPTPRCAAASTVRCSEASIDKLRLLTAPSTAEIKEEGTTSGEFLTYVNATAGAAPGSSTAKESYVYARFTAQGLSKVDLNDQAALASADWDIAFRRYIIRVNGGVSGPSCTTVTQLPANTSFDSVKSVDATWKFQAEDYFTDTCEVVSGLLPGSPKTRLSSYWDYEECLSMSGDVFVLTLADGKHVKLEVTNYYVPEQQKVCNETGKVPQPSDAARIRVRWAFLP